MIREDIEAACGRLLTSGEIITILTATSVLAKEFNLAEDHVLELMGNAKRMTETDNAYMRVLKDETLTGVNTSSVTLALRPGSSEIEPPSDSFVWQSFGLIIEQFLSNYLYHVQARQIDITRPVSFGDGETPQAVVSYSCSEFIKSALRFLHK